VKTKILSILVAVVMLTLSIGTTVLAASPGSPATEFQLYAGGNRCFVGWAGDSMALAKDAEVTWSNWGSQFKVFIPKGTEVTGNPRQDLYRLDVTINHYPLYNVIYMGNVTLKFSQPVVVSELVNGQWSTILTFRTVKSGMPY
jgi:hypothetical protein